MNSEGRRKPIFSGAKKFKEKGTLFFKKIFSPKTVAMPLRIATVFIKTLVITLKKSLFPIEKMILIFS